MPTLKVYTKEEITLEGNLRSIETVRDIDNIIDVDHRVVNIPNAGEQEIINFTSQIPGPGRFPRTGEPLYVRITALQAGDEGMLLTVKESNSGSYTQTLKNKDTFMLNGSKSAIGTAAGTGSLSDIESISILPSQVSKIEYFIANAASSLL